jgi:hypothetical protein
MSYRDPPERREAVTGVADRLRIDAATADVMRGFAAAKVEALVLKGPSLTHWLHDSRHSYVDSDLLIRPGDERGAAEELTRLGFARVHQDDDALPDWWLEHSTEWWRARDGVHVDLHRRVVGIGVEPAAAWIVLARDAENVAVAGLDAPALAPATRLVHVVLHAAQHGIGAGKAIVHVERALAVIGFDLWCGARDVAAELRATDAFSAGVRLAPGGVAMADRLGLPAVRSVEVAIRAGEAPAEALAFERLATTQGFGARAAFVWHKLFPPREFIVRWYPPAAQSRVQLARAYVRRPMWMLRGAPRVFRAWRRARREARGEKPPARE